MTNTVSPYFFIFIHDIVENRERFTDKNVINIRNKRVQIVSIIFRLNILLSFWQILDKKYFWHKIGSTIIASQKRGRQNDNY